MAPFTVKPTKPDVVMARAIGHNTNRRAEDVARVLTWGADEKLLLLLAAACWVASRGRSKPIRRAGNHAFLVTAVASLLPHALKLVFDQTRPDRRTVLGHVHGISFSGKHDDAFPSGHALHMGALASAAGTFPPRTRVATLVVAAGLSLTRVLVLAHWASDVVAGFVIGAVLERLLRFWTGYPLSLSGEDTARAVKCNRAHDPAATFETMGKSRRPSKDPGVAGSLLKSWKGG